jgi:predicted AAA+ superfamily ATPase
MNQPVEYIPRLVDSELADALARAGAVLIEGPKASGKTATALQRAGSMLHVDTDPQVPAAMAIDPGLLLDGTRPRLLDEWQEQPTLWDAVRHAVDAQTTPGQFILTGSTAPSVDVTRHSGAGRFARIRMRTMTLQESGHSSAQVSLSDLVNGEPPRAADPGISFNALLTRIATGGWPSQIALAPEAILANLRDYVSLVAEVDISLVDGVRRDPQRVRRLISALARVTASETRLSTLARDETTLSRDAVREYLSALARLFVIEDQPAWSAHLRSSATLRAEPKRHFCDPSLAVAALGADVASLSHDLRYAGQLFESLAVHELRALSQPLGGSVFHARNSEGREADAIVELPDARWAAFEVKLGVSSQVIDEAAASLKRFADEVVSDANVAPILTVITGGGLSFRRPDGVNVVALTALRA